MPRVCANPYSDPEKEQNQPRRVGEIIGPNGGHLHSRVGRRRIAHERHLLRIAIHVLQSDIGVRTSTMRSARDPGF